MHHVWSLQFKPILYFIAVDTLTLTIFFFFTILTTRNCILRNEKHKILKTRMSHKKISYFATVIFIIVFVVLVPSFVFWQQLVHVFALAWQQLVPAFALAWQQLVPVFAFAWQQRVPVFALFWPVFAFAGPSSSTSPVFLPSWLRLFS